MTTSSGNRYVDFDDYIEFQLEKTRSQIRWTDLLTALAGISVLTVAYLFVFTLLDHWLIDGGFSPSSRAWMLSILVLAQLAWAGWKIAWPAWRTVNELYAAEALEQTDPGFMNSLRTLLELRNRQRPVPAEIRKAIEKQAAVRLSKVNVDQSVDRRLLLSLSYALLVLVVLCCLYSVFSPKKISFLRPLTTASTPVATRTHIVSVRPGSTELLVGSHLRIEVDLEGEIPEQVVAYYSTQDRKFVDEPLELKLVGDALMSFEGVLSGATGQGVQQSLRYRIVAGDAQSEEFDVTVHQPPTAVVDEITVSFPEYMGFGSRKQSEANLDLWDGAEVLWNAHANQPVESARVRFYAGANDNRPIQELGMSIKGQSRLTARWTADFQDGNFPTHYAIVCRNEAGDESVAPPRHSILVRPDEAPEVFLDPAGERSEATNAIVPLVIRAEDPDFLLRNVELIVRRDDELLLRRQLYDAFDEPAKQILPMTRHTLELEKLKLNTGDLLTVWVEARDNRPELGQAGRSQELRIEIVGPVSEQQQQRDLQEDQNEQEDRLEENGTKEEFAQEPEESDPDEMPTEEPSNDRNEAGESPPDDQPVGEAESDAGEGNGSSASPNGQSGDTQDGENGNAQQDADSSSSESSGESGESGTENPAGSERPDGPVDDSEALRQLIENELERQQEEAGSENTPGDQSSGNEGSENRDPSSASEPSNPTDSSDSNESSGENPDPSQEVPENSTDEASGSSDSDPSPDGSPSGEDSGNQSTDGPMDDPNATEDSESSSGDGSEAGETATDAQTPSGNDDPSPSTDGENPSTSNVPEPPTGNGDPASGGDEKTPPSGSAPQSGSPPDGPGQDGPADDASQADSNNPDSQSSGEGERSVVDPDDEKNTEKAATGSESGPAKSADPDMAPSAEAERPDQLQSKDDPTGRRPSDSNQRNESENGASSSESPGQSGNQEGSNPAGSQSGNENNSKPNQPSSDDSSPPQSTKQQSGNDGSSSDSSSPNKDGANGSQSPSGNNDGSSSKPNQSADPANTKPGENSEGMPKDDSMPTEQDSENSNQNSEQNQNPSGQPRDARDSGQAKPGQSKPGQANSGNPQSGESGKQANGQGGSNQSGSSGDGDGRQAVGAGPRSGGGSVGEEPGSAGPGDQGGSDSNRDDPNLEYTRNAANLVLKRLQDQLKRGDVDQELLRKLGWTENDARRFTERLEEQLKLAPDADSLDNEIQRRQFEETLKSFELNDPGVRQKDTYRNKREQGGLSNRRLPVPARFRERFEAFTRSVSGNSKAKPSDPK